MNAAAKAGNATHYYTLNDQFHLAIVHGTGNRSLMGLHENVMWHVHRERHRVNFRESVTSDSASSHTGLLQAIVKGQPEMAGLAMREHLEHVGRLMLAHRQAQMAATTKPLEARTSGTRRGSRTRPAQRAAHSNRKDTT
jgi:DNA-binding GntR family transcriptional regulator